MAAETIKKIMKYKADNSHVRENMNELKLTNQMLTTPFQTMKLINYFATMQQILFFVYQPTMDVNFPIGNVFCVSVLPVLLLLSQELKKIHQTEPQ